MALQVTANEASGSAAPKSQSQAALNYRLRHGDFELFAALARDKAGELDQANLVVALVRLVRELERLAATPPAEGGVGDMRSTAQDLVWPLLRRCEEGLASTTSPHSLANLAWAIARLDELLVFSVSTTSVRPMLLQVLQRSLHLGLAKFPGRDLPVLVWAVACLHRRDCHLVPRAARMELLRRLATVAPLQLPELAPQGLAMLLWALAVLDTSGVDVAKDLGPDVPPTASARAPRALFRAVAEEARKHAKRLKPRELANVAWALATLEVSMPAWLLAELPRRAAQLGPQECANSLWALATSSHSVEDLVRSMPRGGGTAGFGAWKPQEMANAAWALAHSRVGYSAQRGRRQQSSGGAAEVKQVLGDVHAALAIRAAELNGLELAMVAATLPVGACGEDLRAAVSTRATELLARGGLAPDGVVQLVDGLAAAGVAVPPPLVEAFERYFAHTLGILQRVALVAHAAETAEVLQELATLGLTTLGARGTERLLRTLEVLGEAPEHSGEDELTGEQDRRPRGRHAAAAEASQQVRCSLQHHLLVSTSAAEGDEHEHRALAEPGCVVHSGGRPAGGEVGPLLSVALRFPRDRDAEFLALTKVIIDARQMAAEIGATDGGWNLQGSVRLHVSHTPCLSCVAAMLQFRRAFPAVRLGVSFDRP